MKRIVFGNRSFEPTRKIKIVESNWEFRSWMDDVIKCVPTTTKSLTDNLSIDQQVIYFYDTDLPEPQPENLRTHITFPLSTVFLDLVEIDDFRQSILPIKALFEDNASFRSLIFPELPQLVRYLYINSRKEINALDLCLVHSCNIKEELDRMYFPGLVPPHIIVDFSIRIELLPWTDLTHSALSEMVLEFNRVGMNVKFCFVITAGIIK